MPFRELLLSCEASSSWAELETGTAQGREGGSLARRTDLISKSSRGDRRPRSWLRGLGWRLSVVRRRA